MKNSFLTKCILILQSVLFSFVLPSHAFATVTLDNPIIFNDLQEFLIKILDIVVQYGALLIVFFIVFAGFKFVTAQGNTEKIADARKMLVWIIVGAFVLLGSYVIRAAICGTLTNLGVAITC